jgi:UDPglucose 6-dehydrogenase
MNKTVSIIGLGKLGSCMAAVYAEKGHVVVGFDINETPVLAIQQKKAPVIETDLQAFISKNHERLRATTNVSEAINHSSISFVIVPTPSELDGTFSVKYVRDACKNIGTALKEKKDYHLVVLTSTLLPGDCKKQIIPTLEQTSGKKCGTDFGFCYSPLFIAIGSVIHNLLYPDFFLIGENDATSGDILERFYQSVTDNQTPIKRMSIPSAELTKISVNSYITMKITFANMLGEVAESIPGADIDAVTDAIGTDKRIGKAYLKSGLGYGGPCFPRDNRAFACMAKQRGVDVPFALKTDEYNQSIIEHWVAKIKRQIPLSQHIAFVGLSYKLGTAFAEESQAIGIAQRLLKDGYKLHVHNPDGNSHARELLGETVTYHDKLGSCVQNADIVFLGLPMPEVCAALRESTHNSLKPVIDPWRQWSYV